MMHFYKVITFALFSVLCLQPVSVALAKTGQKANPSLAPITIVLHGTTRTTNAVKFLPFLHKALAHKLRTPLGFLSIHELQANNRFYTLAQAISQRDPVNFPLNDFFFFGWSGELSRTARKAAARELYGHIKKLKQNPLYQDRPVRVITHSHGGNVLLSMALYHEENQESSQEPSLRIDQCLLLACPVQDNTEKYLKSPLFKQVITLYTTGDVMQILDPHGLYDSEATTIFSRRVFTQPHSTNLVQVGVTYRKRSLNHISFIEPWFWQIVPHLVETITSEHPCENRQVEPFIVDICPLIKKKKHKPC